VGENRLAECLENKRGQNAPFLLAILTGMCVPIGRQTEFKFL
jgi:hypothetical protein